MDEELIKKGNWIKGAVLFLSVFIVLTYNANAQTKGFIFEPATGSILDPNGDGFISADANGFINNDEGESEITFFKLPTAGSEGCSDGAHSGFTDFVKTGSTEALYFYSEGTYLYVRFRLDGASNSSKTYSVFIDTDEKFGFSGENADPNAITGNPGFEVELAFHSNSGVAIYDIDGNIDPSNNEVNPPYKTNRPVGVYSQKSIAITEECTDDDFFYDFYVPFSHLTSLGIDADTPLRMVAQSGISANPLMGSTSGTDIAGVDDGSSDDPFGLMEDLIDVFPPISGNDLSNGGPFLHRAECPGIDDPIEINATQVSGTSNEAVDAVITIYADDVSLGTTSVIAGTPTNTWSKTGLTALAGGTVITATAFIVDEKAESVANCNPVIVNQTCSESPGVTGLTSPARGLTGTSTEANGTAISIWTDAALADPGDLWDQVNTNNPSTVSGGTWTIQGTGGFRISDGVYYVTAQNTTDSECLSDATIYCVGVVNPSVEPVISTSPILESTSSITGTSGTAAFVEILIDGVESGFTDNADGSGDWTIPVSGLEFGQVISARGTDLGLCPTSSNSTNDPTVTRYSIAPAILIEYCNQDGQTITSVSGISSENGGSSVNLYTKASAGVTTANTLAGTGTVDANGNWTVTGLNLLGGTYMAATNTAVGELESPISNEKEILSQTVDNNLTIDIMPITEGDISISGKGTTGNVVQLFIDDIAIAGFSTTVDGSGDWIITNLDAANAGFDILFPGGLVGMSSTATGQCESALVYDAEAIACRAYDQNTIALTTASSVCNNELISVQFDNSEEFIFYQLYTDASATTATGLTVVGDGTNILLTSGTLETTDTKLYLEASRVGVSCDAIFPTNFNITVKAPPTLTLTDNSLEICAGTSTTEVEYASVTNGPLISYDINFDATAEGQGFTDIVDASIASNFSYSNPINAVEDTYNATVQVANTASGNCISPVYAFTFRIIDDNIAYGTVIDPTCLENDGSIQVTGLNTSKTYTLDYNLDGSGESISNVQSDVSGNYLVDNIVGGDYNNFSVSESGCTSNILTATQSLTPPATPIVTISSVDITEGDASISGTGTTGTQIDLYIDDVLQVGFNDVVDINGDWMVTGLDAASAGSDILTPGGILKVSTSLGAGCAVVSITGNAAIACKPFDDNIIAFLGDTDVCINETRSVTFENSQTDIVYQLFTDNLGVNATGSSIIGDGSNITLTSATLTDTNIDHLYLKASRADVDCEIIYSTSFAIQVKGIPSLELSNTDITICSGITTIDLNYSALLNTPTLYDLDFNVATQGVGVNDLSNQTFSSNLSFNIPVNTPSGDYSGILTIANNTSGSCSNSYNFNFSVISEVISYGAVTDPTCIATDGSIVIGGLAVGETYTLDYLADGGSESIIDVQSDGGGNYLVSDLAGGDYSNFRVTRSGCTSNILAETKTLTPPVPTNAEITLVGDTELCVNETLGINITSSLTNIQYQIFTDAAGLNSTGTSMVGDGTDILLTTDPLSANINHLYIKGSRTDVVCSDLFSTSFSIIVRAAPSLTFENNSFILCENLTKAEIPTTGINNSPTFYDIDFDAQAETEGFVDLVDATMANQIFFDIPLNATPDDYTATLQVANNSSGSCSSPVYDFSFKISKDQITNEIITHTDVCDGDQGSILVSGFRDDIVYDINYTLDNNAETISTIMGTNGDYTIDKLFKGSYNNFSITASGCESNILNDPLAITDPETPVISIVDATEPTNCLGANGFMTIAGLTSGFEYDMTYTYNDMDLSVSFTADETGSYILDNLSNGHYLFFQTTRLDCESNLIEEETAFICDEELYNTPVISPNGDGFNDFMEIEGIEVFPNNKVTIFNRWGNLVWEISPYQNDNSGFGGQGNAGRAGGALTDGTYFIVIDLGEGGVNQNDFVVIKR